MDPFEMDRRLPSHQQRLASEKKTNVYYIPGTDKTGQLTYAYVICSAMLHEQFVDCVRVGEIPDYAVVVEIGTGEPTPQVKKKIMDYYGFDHDAALEEQ